MTVFVSHNFDDQAQFENVTDALEREGIDFWRPDTIQAGGLLADQLHAAVLKCGLCVFIATAKSVRSAWCATELGAFWGSGKKVLVYASDSTLEAAHLPGQLQGHVLERRLARLTKAIELHLNGAAGAEESASPLIIPAHLRKATDPAQHQTIPMLVNSLELRLTETRESLAKARAKLAQLEKEDPNSSNVSIEGFEMAYAEHVSHLEQAIHHLKATEEGLWSLR